MGKAETLRDNLTLRNLLNIVRSETLLHLLDIAPR